MSGIVFLTFVFTFAAIAGVVYVVISAWGELTSRYKRKFESEAEVTAQELFLSVSAHDLFLFGVAATILIGGGAYFLIGSPLALLFGLVGFFLPHLFLRLARRRRLQKFEIQLADALSLLASSLRAGMGLSQGLDILTKEMGPPIRQEFGMLRKEMLLGLSDEEAFENLGKRVPSEDLALVVTAVVTTKKVGGNLAEIFDTIAHVVRERMRMKGKIAALTAEGKAQGVIVGLMPFILAIIIYSLEPALMRPLFTHLYGWLLIAGVVTLELIGLFVIMKIVRIET